MGALSAMGLLSSSPGDFLEYGGFRGLESCPFFVLFFLAGLKFPTLWRFVLHKLIGAAFVFNV